MFEKTLVRIGKSEFVVTQSSDGIKVNDKLIEFHEFSLSDRYVTLKINDKIERFVVNRNGDDLWLSWSGREYPVSIETERDRLLKVASRGTSGDGGSVTIRSAMPGLVVRVNVKPGQPVKHGDAVLILEAMKMENEVRSPFNGFVEKVLVSEKDSVEKGAHLIVLGQ